MTTTVGLSTRTARWGLLGLSVGLAPFGAGRAVLGCAERPSADHQGARPVARGAGARSDSRPAPAPNAARGPLETTPAVSPREPAALRCLRIHYGGEARQGAAGWALILADGYVLPFERSPNANTSEQNEVAVVDLFEQRYRRGPLIPPARDYDPGRVRSEPLMKATYGHDAKEVAAALVPIQLGGQTFSVHRRIRAPLERVAARLRSVWDASLAPYFEHPGGTFNWRTIAGTQELSNHAWAIALDLNVPLAHYWRNEGAAAAGSAKGLHWQNRYPARIVDAFEAEGFIWGGRWYHYDTMHFEYRPELLDPSCYEDQP